jgi:hypothetical protein
MYVSKALVTVVSICSLHVILLSKMTPRIYALLINRILYSVNLIGVNPQEFYVF